MTHTEQPIDFMNETIARFDGWKEKFTDDWYREPYCGQRFLKAKEFKYHSSWDALMPVWLKLYENISKRKYRYEELIAKSYIGPMTLVMITGNITEAHRILFNAIEWINKNNGDGK
jgi:hypothetical protein